MHLNGIVAPTLSFAFLRSPPPRLLLTLTGLFRSGVSNDRFERGTRVWQVDTIE